MATAMASTMSDLKSQRSRRTMMYSTHSWTRQGGPAAAQALVTSAAGDDRHDSYAPGSAPGSTGSSPGVHGVPGIGSGGARMPASVGRSMGSVGSLPDSNDWPRPSPSLQQAGSSIGSGSGVGFSAAMPQRYQQQQQQQHAASPLGSGSSSSVRAYAEAALTRHRQALQALEAQQLGKHT
jgi:hypothetical protein